MLTTIEGIFDGQTIQLLEHVPFRSKKKVLITFLDDISSEKNSTEEIDPIKALRGSAKASHLTEKLLKSRKEDMILETRSRNT